MRKSCYYAHSVALYGTPQEARDLALLDELFPIVVNPSAKEHQENYITNGGMDYFEKIVKGCDVLAFRAHVDGRIGAGVATEIEWALEYGMPILELPTMINSRVLSIEQTRDYLKEVGQR